MAASTTTVRWLGVGGVIAPVGFVTAALIQGLTRPDYSLLAHPISALAAGPNGWIQDLNFAVTGALMIGFAIGIHLTVTPTRAGAIGPVFVALFGVGLLGAAAFPATDAAGQFIDDRVPHVVANLVALSSAALGALVLSWRLARDPAWKPLAGYVRTVGVTLVVLFLAGSAVVRPAGAPFHEWLGLFQWIFLAVWYPTVVVLALRLIRPPMATDA